MLETESGRYFVANDAMIYLKLESKLKRCDRMIYKTDLKESTSSNNLYISKKDNHIEKRKLKPNMCL